MAIDQARRPGSGRAGRPRLEAPSRLGTAQHGSTREQSYGRLGATVQPRSLSEAPIERSDLAAFGSPGISRAAADVRGAGAVALPVQQDGSNPQTHPSPSPSPSPNPNQVTWPFYLRNMMVVGGATAASLCFGNAG